MSVRRARRLGSLGLDVRWHASDREWKNARLVDLSLGGALLSCGAGADGLKSGQRLAVVFERRSDGLKFEVTAEITRIIARENNPHRVATRFVELKQDAAKSLSLVMNEGEAEEDAADDDDDVFTSDGAFAGKPLHLLRLHEMSLYELFAIDAACANGELESRCEELIALVDDARAKAVGKRESRLNVLHQSLLRMRPLWNDPVKRARYDLRWGFFRVEDRLDDADAGKGLPSAVLAAIWFDLYPDQVRAAEKVMLRAREDGIVTCLKKALELDPFNRRRRQRLDLIENPPEPDDEGPAMPAPGAVPTVRGSVGDLPLFTLLRAAAEDDEDLEVVLRKAGKAVGVVGVTRGEMVTAIAGDTRGVDALRKLHAIVDATFVAKYTSPRIHLRHMKTRALDMIEQALNETGAFSS